MYLTKYHSLRPISTNDCPYYSNKPTDWLEYIEKYEENIRLGYLHVKNEEDIILLYETAIETLPECWSDESYIIIYIRYTILKGNQCLTTSYPHLVTLRMCAHFNTRLMITLVVYSTLVGDHKEANYSINKAKLSCNSDFLKQLLDQAINIHKNGASLQSIAGAYEYIPYFEGEWRTAIVNHLITHKKTSKWFPPPPKIRHSLNLSTPKAAIKHPLLTKYTQKINTTAQFSTSNDSGSDMDISLIGKTSPTGHSLTATPANYFRKPLSLPTTTPFKESEKTLTYEHQNYTPEDEEPVDTKIPIPVMTRKTEPPSKNVTLAFTDSNSNERNFIKPSSLMTKKSNVQKGKQCTVTSFSDKDKENISVCKRASEQSKSLKHNTVLQINTSKNLPNAITDCTNLSVQDETYFILREIGRGGFSTVFCALNKAFELRALKKVELSSSTEAFNACKNEVNLLESLKDSGRVINLYSYELTEQRLLMVMELAEQNLKLFIKQRVNLTKTSILTNSFIVFFWTEMLACVKVIHDHRIVHLDLKPENFVLVQGCLKLIDLGISQRLPLDCTHMDLKQHMGSILYMSPEQLSCIGLPMSPDQTGNNEGEPKVRLKTDIWSLGIMLYEMLYGYTPFGKTNTRAIFAKLLDPNAQIHFSPLSNVLLEKAVKWCLNRNIRLRPSVDELLALHY